MLGLLRGHFVTPWVSVTTRRWFFFCGQERLRTKTSRLSHFRKVREQKFWRIMGVRQPSSPLSSVSLRLWRNITLMNAAGQATTLGVPHIQFRTRRWSEQKNPTSFPNDLFMPEQQRKDCNYYLLCSLSLTKDHAVYSLFWGLLMSTFMIIISGNVCFYSWL